MKKIYLTLTIALMCILGVTVNAEEGGYAPGVNSYTNSITDGAKTVIIYKGDESTDITSQNIYYIDQSDGEEGFSNLEMLMKSNAPAGFYTVLVTGGKTTKFEISDAQAFVSGATEIEFLGVQEQSDSSYSVALGLRPDLLLTDVSTLTMVMGDKAYTTALFGEQSIINWNNGSVYTENEKLMFAIQIDNVSKEYITEKDGTSVPNFSLYIK